MEAIGEVGQGTPVPNRVLHQDLQNAGTLLHLNLHCL